MALVGPARRQPLGDTDRAHLKTQFPVRLSAIDALRACWQGGVMSHANARSYEAAMRALAAGDVDSYMAFLAEDVQWWDLGSREPVIGKEAVAQLLTSNGLAPDIEIHDVLANDEHLVALIHFRATRDMEEFDVSHAEVLHFNHGRQVTKRQIFPSNIWSSLKLLGLSDQPKP